MIKNISLNLFVIKGMAQAWHFVGIVAVRCAHKKY